jgi:hypothetical protein
MTGMVLGGLADLGVGAMRDHNIPNNMIFLTFALLCAVAAIVVLCIRPNARLVK